MPTVDLEEVVRNVDRRLERVEQILPTLPTREEMHAAIREAVAPLATKEELRALATKEELRALVTKEELRALATKEELRAAIEPLATKDELAAAIEPLATKDELAAAIEALATKEELRAAIAPLATKEELRAAIEPLATKADVEDAFERARRYTQIHYESLKDEIRIVAEGVASLQASFEQIVRPTLEDHERRISLLETGQRPGPRQGRG